MQTASLFMMGASNNENEGMPFDCTCNALSLPTAKALYARFGEYPGMSSSYRRCDRTATCKKNTVGVREGPSSDGSDAIASRDAASRHIREGWTKKKRRFGAAEESRTLDLNLGKVA
ncbi:MAG TPA: hypothetical protein PKX01_17495, partial [Rhodocyclaceae bacterium]|uniref:hypothetical protein n=1 Tax=Accumulibacter sp. TaxID=2053492 RepID=UPI002D0CC5B1